MINCYFLLFIKEINEEDELVFHSFISLPDQAEYQHIDEATKQLIGQSIDKQIFENIKNGMTPFNSEIEGIRLFEEMIDESYLLDLSQLEDVVIVPADTDIIFQIELPASTTLASRDDDGYEATVVKIADGVNDLNPANLSELIPLNLNIGSVPVSIGYAISSKLNNIQEKNAATAFYNNCERDIVIHFSIEYENATVLDGITYVTGGNVVIQIENNMTIEKANQIVNQEIYTQVNNHLQYSLPSDAGTTITNHHQTEEDRALSLLKLGYNHLVNRVEDLGMTIDDIAPDEDEFAYAIGTGLFDGLMGTIFGIFELSKGMLKAGGGVFKKAANYVNDLIKLGIKEKSFRAVCDKFMEDVETTYKTVVNTISSICDDLLSMNVDSLKLKANKVIINIKCTILDWMKNMASGSYDGSYQIGVLSFDVIFTALSFGTGASVVAAKNAGRFAAKIAKPLSFIDDYSFTQKLYNQFDNIPVHIGKLNGQAKKVTQSKYFKCLNPWKGMFYERYSGGYVR